MRPHGADRTWRPAHAASCRPEYRRPRFRTPLCGPARSHRRSSSRTRTSACRFAAMPGCIRCNTGLHLPARRSGTRAFPTSRSGCGLAPGTSSVPRGAWCLRRLPPNPSRTSRCSQSVQSTPDSAPNGALPKPRTNCAQNSSSSSSDKSSMAFFAKSRASCNLSSGIMSPLATPKLRTISTALALPWSRALASFTSTGFTSFS